MRALVPAAGFGTRFRPATLTTPKPLLPLLGVPILVRLFRHLRAQGVTSAVLNAHHLAETLVAAVGDACEGIPVAFSPEDPILGTAGAIRRASERGLLGDGAVPRRQRRPLHDAPLRAARPALDAPGVVSALGVLPHAAPGETALWGDAEGRLVSLGDERPFPEATGPWLFTGLQCASPALVSRIPPGVSELARDVLRPSTQRRDGAFALVPYRVPEDGLWFDLGSPAKLAAAEEAIAAAASPDAAIPAAAVHQTRIQPLPRGGPLVDRDRRGRGREADERLPAPRVAQPDRAGEQSPSGEKLAMSERPKRTGSERSPAGFPFGSRATKPGMKPTVTFGQRFFTETGP
jgi:Nucleoside-diphosphate-sugar pyrophosphorylase involved in lipopolysaccharide biosynthesis/translation initiation factor 2B, gamma/epsilon subunits (eIF-2Bgamma/eIF-2Bepsilon)